MNDSAMHDAWNEKLPFYVAGTLPESERVAVERHLAACEPCRAELRQWQLLATAARADAEAREAPLPPLSPVVRANLVRRPTVGEALRSAAQLVWAQRQVLGVLLPGAALVLLLGILGTLVLQDEIHAALPLLAAAPIVAAVSVAYLHHAESDPAWEVVAATPTSAWALVFARLTLLLAVIVTVMLVGSVAVSAVTGRLLASLIAAWLGPLLLLSALATVLALRWTPALGAGVCLALWVTIIAMLIEELAGDPLLTLSLQPLLEPGWALFGGQLVAAALLWCLGLRLAQSRPVLSRGLA